MHVHNILNVYIFFLWDASYGKWSLAWAPWVCPAAAISEIPSPKAWSEGLGFGEKIRIFSSFYKTL